MEANGASRSREVEEEGWRPEGTDSSVKEGHREAMGIDYRWRVAECSIDFNDLVGNHPRACDKFHPLVPRLGRASKVSNHVTIPLFSVQVTLFPNSGISIGITSHHTLCDASTNFDFLKAWTAIARHGTDELFLASGSISLPFYDRVIKYPDSLDEIFMNAPGIESLCADHYQPTHLASNTNKVRATFVFTRSHISRMKKWLLDQKPRLEYVSSFSVVCGYVWSCIAKSRAQIGEDDLERFCLIVLWVGGVEWIHHFLKLILVIVLGHATVPLQKQHY
ncbi:hypothetical protein L1987_63401 [Smallanthus sonchifolius]|uniref:Uncharacterized protein n=1 Tax=Smallanthus sonchifolius TaxID=185202 RepID=A0ACB9CD67_9ASTR|nr:hypothetical protein L1987_63401 [Smallanthus sonchifolius]